MNIAHFDLRPVAASALPGPARRALRWLATVSAALVLSVQAFAVSPSLGRDDVIVADAGSSAATAALVQIVASSGAQVTLTGNGAGSGATLDTPLYVTVGSSSAVYYYESVDATNLNKIVAVDPSTGIRTVVGGSAFTAVTDMIWDPSTATLIVADAGTAAANSSIIRVNPTTGGRSTITGNGTGSGATFDTARHLACTQGGTIYYHESADATNLNKIVAVNPATGARTVVGGSAFTALTQLAWDVSTKTLIVSDADTSAATAKIIRVDPANGNRTTISIGSNTTGGSVSLDTPQAVNVSSSGAITYFESADATSLKKVVSVNPATGVRTVLSATAFTAPTDLAVVSTAVSLLRAPFAVIGSATTASLTIPAGSNRLLLVSASDAGATSITSVTFGGTALTRAVTRTDSTAVDEFWYLLLGTSTSSTAGAIAITSPTTATPVITAVAFQNVNQSVPVSGAISNQNSTANAASSLVIASAAGDMVYDLFDSYNSGGIPVNTPNAGQTFVTTAGGALGGGGFGRWSTSLSPGAASVTTGWTYVGGALIQLGLNIKQATAVSAPAVSSPTSTGITSTAATLGGNVTTDGGATVTARGVVLSATATNSNPQLAGTGVTPIVGTGTTGVFTVSATSLTAGTAYSYAAYATNSVGTTYSSVGTFTTLSTNANLAALALSTGTLSPSFASGTTGYTASVVNATATLTVTPTVAQANATITVNGNAVTSGNASGSISLIVGANTITTVVTAQDGSTTKTYTVVVTRAASANADLSALTLSTGTLAPTFAAGTTSYTASVSNATTTLTVTPTVAEANATVKVNNVTVTSASASGSIALSVGANTVTTLVTAQDGTTTKTYTVTVTRAASANADLSALALSAGTLTPAFAAGTTGYTAGVSNATTSLTVTPTLSDSSATVSVNGTPVTSGSASGSISLSVGANTLTTLVTAQDGTTTKTYTVTVTRAAVAPTVTTPTSASVTGNTATLGGNVTSDGGSAITERGVVYSLTATNSNPQLGGTGVLSATTSGSTGVFTVSTANLVLGASYTYAAYATNSVGTSYSATGTFTTGVTGSLIDTTQADFASGTPTNVSTAASPGDVTLVGGPVIDQQNTDVTTNGFGFNSTSWAGQTFTAGASGPLTRVDLDLFASGVTGTTPNITVSIRATTGTPAVPTGADLATATIAGFNSSTGGYFPAIFGSPVTVTAGTIYAVIFRAVSNPSAGTYAYVGSFTPNSNPYANGLRVTSSNSGSTWTADATAGGRDLGFVTYVGSGFAAAGDLVSSLKDSNLPAGTTHWSTLSWTATTPASTSLKFQVAASDSPSGPFTFVGPDGTAGTYFTTSGASLAQFYGYRYLKYRAYLATTDSAASPTLNDVTVAYDLSTTPTVTSPTSTAVTGTAATLGGNVTSDGGATVTARGVVVSATTTNSSPQVSGTGVTNFTASGTTGIFTVSATGLTPGTAYTYAAYATNSQGTAYSSAGTFTTLSANANLSALALSAGTLAPTFASGTVSYTASVSNATTSLTVTPTVAQAGATITVNGSAVASGSASASISLSVGANVITTVVTAPDGTTTKTYTATVTRAPSSNAALSALSLSAGTLSPTFASGTASYTASVTSATASLTVTPTVADSTATVTVNGSATTSGSASAAINLVGGANTLTVVATAQDGTTTQTYTVTVTRAVDYTLTVSGGALVVTNVSGNADTVALTESSGSLVVSVSGRAFTVNGGSGSANSASVALSGLTGITINGGPGNDTVNVGAFATALPSLTINGNAGDDTVNMNGSVTFAPNASLDVDLQNDTATPGIDAFNVNAGNHIVASGTGSITVRVSRGIAMDTGASLETVNGGITLEANQQAIATAGSFKGISIFGTGTIVRSTGTGIVTVKGRGGNSGTFQVGVQVWFGGQIVGGTAGTVTVTGTGGASTGNSPYGVDVQNTGGLISSLGAAVNVTGFGGGTGAAQFTYGVGMFSGATITSGGGTITVNGTGGATTYVGVGVWVDGADTKITSATGNISVAGQASADSTGAYNIGILVQAGAKVTSTGTGANAATITMVGTGGGGTTENYGFDLEGSVGVVSSVDGAIKLTGTAGGGGVANDTFAATIGYPGNPTESIVTTGTASIELIADTVRIVDTTATIGAGANTVTIRPKTAGLSFSLGTASTDTVLGLTDAALDRITAGTLVLGDSQTGPLTVSSAITRPASTNLSLNSAGTIALNSSVDTAGGNLALNAASVTATGAGTDVALNTGTLSAASGTSLAFALNGTTPDTGYNQLKVVGAVNLTGTTLSLTGTYAPAGVDVFTLIDNDGTDAITGTFTGLAQGATIANVLGSGRNATLSYTGGTGNDVVLTMQKNTPTVTWTAPSAITYGTALSATQLNATASVPGAFAYTPALGAVLNAGNAQTLSVTFTPTDTNNYNVVTQTVALDVAKAALTVTADAKTKVYGSANPTLTATITGFVNGQVLATSGVTGAASVTTAATTATGVSSATITAALGNLASSNYSFSFVAGTLSITKAPLTVTADAKSKVYGAANPTLTATLTGFVNGQVLGTSDVTGAASVTTTATTLTGVGSATITSAVGSLASANYSFTFADGALTITKAPLTIAANPVGRAYGSANPTLTGVISGFVNSETLATSGVTGTPTYTTTATPASPAGPYAITAAVGNLASANYAFTTFVDSVLTVGQVTLTVTADAKTKVYGSANPDLTATITGFVLGQTLATSGITGSPSVTTAATSATAVGSPVITAAAGTLVSANYAFTFVNSTLTITKAPLTVTADAKSKVYGAVNPALTATITGFVNGQVLGTSDVTGAASVTTTATTLTGVGSATITSAVGSLASANYSFGPFVDGTLTITKAPLTVTADAKTKVYGAANPALTATLTGFVNSQTLATSGVTGTASVTTTATTATGVSSPVITAALGSLSSANYSFGPFVDGTLTIAKAPLTITANPVGRSYGAANPTLTGVISGFVNNETLVNSGVTGAASYSTTAILSSPVGTYPITPAVGTLDAANYAFTTFVNGVLTVGQVTLTVTADPKTRLYGAANPAFTATITGFVLGETLATSGVTGSPALTTPAIATTPVGTPAIAAAVGSLVSANYAFSFVPGVLTITKAPLTVTADAQTRTYGTGNPVLTATITGFANNETLATSGVTGTASVTTPANPFTPAGSATLTVSLGTLASANYSFATFVNGTLTIAKAPLTVMADIQTKVYGDPLPTLGATITGFKNGETLPTSGVTGAPTVTTAATAATPVSVLPVTISLGSLAAANYSFTFVDNTLTVTKAPLTITGNSTARIYGAANPAFSGVITGFVLGETLASSGVTGSAAYTTPATPASSVGLYPIAPNAGTLAAANYAVVNLVPGTLTITQSVLTVTAQNKSRLFGAANPAFTAVITGYLNGDTLAVVAGVPDFTTTATAASNVGTYPIAPSLGSLTATNYAFTFAPGSLTVTPAVLTVLADPATRTYGAANPAFTATLTGFVNGDTRASTVTGNPVFTTVANPSSPVGSYQVTIGVGTLFSLNYTFVIGGNGASGTLTVNKATLTVTADAKSRAYGAANPTLTATLTGFVNNETASAISGAATLSTTATTASAPGSYPIAIAAGTLASQNYDFTLAPGTLTVNKAALTVTADAKSRAYGAANPALTATLTGFANGDTAAVVTGTAALSTAATTASNVGAYPITPSLGTLAAANYSFANFVAGTLTVTSATATVELGNLSQTYDGQPKSVTVTTTPASLATNVSYGQSAQAPTNAGSYAVSAIVNSTNYAGSATGTLVIAKAAQTVTFPALTGVSVGVTVALNATATSGLPVTFAVISGNANLTGSQLTLGDANPVVLRASQAGNANYLPASADQTISNATRRSQTITFVQPADHFTTDAPFPVTASASSGLPVTFAIVSGPAALSGSAVILNGASGSVVIQASQAGDAAYAPAAGVTRTISVTARGPQVYFGGFGGTGGFSVVPAVTAVSGGLAVNLAPDGQDSTIIGYLPTNGDGFVLKFRLAADGSFSATTTSIPNPTVTPTERFTPAGRSAAAAITLTFHGQVTSGVLTGIIDELNLPFSATLQAETGPEAELSGFYQAEPLNSASGNIYSIVSAEGNVFVLAVTPTYVGGGTGTVSPAGNFTINTPQSGVVSGNLDAASTSVTGTLTLPSQPAQNFAGLGADTIRTDRLVNLSSRARILPNAGNSTSITGFVIGGSDPKQVLLRAMGPALTGLGVTGAAADPQLRVYNSAGLVVAENDNWSGTALATLFTSLGASPLASGSKDAAVLVTLSPGTYSMHVFTTGTAGVALSEIYDASSSPATEYQRLVNISSRGPVGTGENVLIAGFVVTGNSPKRILIRGTGPALAQFLGGTLSDPYLRLFSNGTVIAQNNDWQTQLSSGVGQSVATSADLAAAAAQTGASPLAAGSKDAALIVVLAPGVYSAMVSGVNGATGIALVEVYEIAP